MISSQQDFVNFSSSDNLISLSVHLDTQAETVWLNLNQLSELFDRDKSVISRHLKKIFETAELEKDSVVAFFATTAADGKTYTVEYFNLDVILSVGYRVNSKRGMEFRRWASSILKEYLIKGYAINQERLSTIGMQEISRSLDILKHSLLTHGSMDDIGHAALDIIRSYSKSWLLLNAFDENRLSYQSKMQPYEIKFTTEFCLTNIAQLKQELIDQKEASSLFGIQREHGLDQILGSIHQTFSDQFLYPSVYERAAHLFYFTLKDHPFVDGNKRIGSFLLLLYLAAYNIQLFHITNESLVALALLVAQSNPNDKDIIIKLILNLITKDELC
ncbi:virulence protein RhuM/Fic/DOC family protein [Candidatus Odyssella acanthamoebae]|uniref:Cytochrome C n=1 Tax=Candidatus Odyssella acanthamoebae TaxID=91604 RepID=A0A077AVX6_9PROT|nr:virulence protein RhuM/Fic/DOC family protein [Candidatus Paracaedibacter acanthamoebae]AIK97312.1 cytochrome C [Candidatus Paracaedibacter acanthamoebae]